MAQSVNGGKEITWLSINADGYFTSKANENDKGAQEYTNDKGEKYWRKLYTRTDEGFLTGVWIQEADFGKRLKIAIESEFGKDIIDLPLFNQNKQLNGHVRSFANLINKIPLDKKISISPTRKKNDKGYTYKSFYIDCEGELIKSEVPFNELPEFKLVEGVGGTKTWDTTEHDKFLYLLLEKGMKAIKLKGEQSIASDAPSESLFTSRPGESNELENTGKNFYDEGSEMDDLPF